MKELKTDQDIEIAQNFELAVSLVKSLPQKGSFQPSYAEAAKIYSFFKQAKFGPCNIPRPGFWDYINRAKWDAWAALGHLSQTEAMKNYVDEIKNIYLRVKELDEFQEREHQFADVVIPFCQTNNIQMSDKLLEIVKKENTLEAVTKKNNDDNPESKSEQFYVDTKEDSYKINGEHDFLTEDESINGNNVNINDTLNHEHSILVENTILTDSKIVKFGLDDKVTSQNVNGIDIALNANGNESSSRNISDKNSTSEDEEEVYCDPIDPETLSKIPINESSMITTDSGTHFEETIRTSKRISVRKRNDRVESSSDSHNGCLQKELEKPYKSNRGRHYKKPVYRQHGIKSHKRFDEQAKPGGGNYHPSNDDQRAHSSQPSRNTTASQSHHSVHLHTQRNSQGDGSDSSGNCSSSSTYSVDTIGLKIVNALERMEDNMESILARLDSIEDTIKEVTRPKTPWWQQYMPSKTVLIWTVWPVVVNIMFYIYWKRFLRRKIKKC